MDDEKIVLEPCPFCGIEAKEFESYMFRLTHLPGCWLVQQGLTSLNRETIFIGAGDINFWNTREGR